MIAEGDNVTNCAEGDAVEVRQQGLFIGDPYGKFVRQRVRYWLGQHFLVELNVTHHDHGWRHWVGRSREG